MAMADLVIPRLPDHQQSSWFHRQPTGHQRSFSYHVPQSTQQQYQQYQQYQQSPPPPQPQIQQSSDISPLSTSNSTSPISPKNYHGRQVRPLYMPAVLRPTEYSSIAASNSSTKRGEENGDERAVRTSGSFTSLTGILSLSRLSRRSTGESDKFVDWNWDIDNYPKVDGQPTRKHWKPDPESDVCDDPTCKKYFNYFVRRHHCRRCGNIFCDIHSGREVPLDESANYNPRGELSRACEHCYGDFKVWRSRNSSKASIIAQQAQKQGTTKTGSRTVPVSPISTSPSGASPTTPGKSQPEVAVSVPSDWNWSTF